ncbi:MAG: RHS repeat protein [Lachnospiraceae bacterium]|nr:RHS repeat protein [Lachnospiraceae bacterium]
MKTKIKVQAILCLILIVVTTLMQSPTEAKAYALCEPCFAEKQAGGAYGYRYYYIVDLSGAVTEYVYNSKGLLVEETNPLGEVTVYTYDTFDRLLTTKTPDGTITSYKYTKDGKTIGITATQANGETEELRYRYTPEGYLAAAISEATTDEYTYTERGEVASVTRNGTYRLELSRDEAGNLVELKELCLTGKTQESVTLYEYDAGNRLVKVVQDGEILAEYDYDGNGRLIYQADGIGNVTKYVYGKENQLACMETKTAEGAVLYREENSYNANGSITGRKVSGLVPSVGGTAGEFTFCYDEYDRLIKEQGVYGTIMYTYDVMGNRLSKTENGATTYYTYDLCNKLVSEKTGEAETIYRYDGMGNLVKKIAPEGETGYFYNAFSQLELVTTPTGARQESFYDAFGIRSSLKENGATTQYMTYNGIVLAAYNTNGERTEHYTYGNKILAWE